MPRERSQDYDSKAQAIKDAAAELFARTGYTAVKLSDVAKVCGASKSMLYHYFPTKDDLLFEMLKEHLETLIESLEQSAAAADDGTARFTLFLQTFIQKSSRARQCNVVAQHDAKYLPKAMRTKLDRLQARVLELVAEQLHGLNPRLDASLYKPYALLLLGTLNWTDTWYSTRGPLKPQELIERISSLFLDGFLQQKG